MNGKYLKLEGMLGLSDAPGHIGEIPVSDYFFSNDAIPRAGNKDNSHVHHNHLEVFTWLDSISDALKLAWTKSRKFKTASFIIDDASDTGFVRTTTFKLQSVVIDKVDGRSSRPSIGLKFERMSVVR